MRPTPEMVRAIEARVRAMVARLRSVADRRGASAVDRARAEAAEGWLRLAEEVAGAVAPEQLRHVDTLEAAVLASAWQTWEDTLAVIAGMDGGSFPARGSSALH